MKALRVFIIVILLGALYAAVNQVVVFARAKAQIGQSLHDARDKAEAARREKESLTADMEYLSRPANLEKEIRSRFNYKRPDEKMLIVVPASPSSSENP